MPREPLQKPDWYMPVKSRQGAQTLTRRWGNHTDTSPSPAEAEILGKVLCLAGGSSLLGCGGFTAVLSAQRETEGEWFECAAL